MTLKRSPKKQGIRLVAKSAFTFKAPGERGRPVVVRPGQRFWVTNSTLDQERQNVVMIDREGRGHISNGYAFTPETIDQYFEETDR
jgi:hypothetical protein